MKRIIIASAVMILLSTLTARAQRALLQATKKLEVYVGTWTGTGKSEATPLRNKTEFFTATVSCSWYPDAPQVVCSEEGGLLTVGETKSLAIFGHSLDEKPYYAFVYDGLGKVPKYFGTVDGSIWTYYGSFTVAGNTYQSRMVFNFTSPNECTQKIEFSEDGENWILDRGIKWTKEVAS
jgi:hypothetical protein